VSYISEVPVWKSTYRIVFPREANGKATLQGWAVVDNTVGADWDNVQLSLVAGAPQSFIQPLSQPLYARRVEVPIATELETTPQTHEAADASEDKSTINSEQVETAKLEAPKLAMPTAPRASAQLAMKARAGSFGVAGREASGSSAGASLGYVGGSGVAGGVYRPSDAISEGDVSTNAFDDFFEYSLAQPVTIHKNESAMVPILQQDLHAEHVTLWSEQEATPLRAVWLENTSKLTLDSGSFSIFEAGEFAGEGLLDPIHPGEKRLLSYAADQAVRVKVTARDGQQRLHHVSFRKGVIVETYMDTASVTYSATNSADVDRVVLLEHPRRNNGWTLDGDLKADESSTNLYRFKLAVPPHSTQKLEVKERGPRFITVNLISNPRQEDFLLRLVKDVPNAQAQIQPVIDAGAAVGLLEFKIAEAQKTADTASADEARDRENLTALKGNDAAKRFVDELNHAEDQLQATRKQIADLEQQKQAALDKLNALIASISFDWDVELK
jgi:hypothetical protein